jgi:tetratricopeptide (TPR) repeat protein
MLMRLDPVALILILFFLIYFVNLGDAVGQDPDIYISDNVSKLKEKGDALYKQGRYQEAIEYYDRALAMDPNDVSALNNKGNALGDLGRYQEAIEYYDRALAIDPNDADALYNKGNPFVILGDSTYPRINLVLHCQ